MMIALSISYETEVRFFTMMLPRPKLPRSCSCGMQLQGRVPVKSRPVRLSWKSRAWAGRERLINQSD